MKKEKKRVGKPALYKKPMKRRNIHMSDEHVQIAIGIGGSIANGVRIALDEAAEKRKAVTSGRAEIAVTDNRLRLLYIP